MGADGIVRDAHGNTHYTLATRTLAHHLHYPRLVGIADRERFAFGAETVGLHEVRHYGDCLACRLGALQGYVYQRAVVENARRVYHLLPSSESGFSDGHLVFVDVSDNVIRLGSLRNLSVILVRVPVVDLPHLTLGMFSGREMA